MRIDVHEFFKTEHRHFYGEVRRNTVEPRTVTESFYFFTEHRAHCKFDHRHARHFADIGHRAARTRIHFDHIEIVVVDEILNIDKPFRAERKREFARLLDNFLPEDIVEIPRRVHGDRIAGMNARAFDVLHDTRNQNVFAVADRIDFEFGTAHVFVDEHRIFDALRKDDTHVFAHIGVSPRDDHILSAEHVRRPQQNRIADAPCGRDRFFRRQNRFPCGFIDTEFDAKRFKFFAVFRNVDRFGARAENFYALFIEKFC